MEGFQGGDSFSDVTLRFTSDQKLFGLITVRPKSVCLVNSSVWGRLAGVELMVGDEGCSCPGMFSSGMPGK